MPTQTLRIQDETWGFIAWVEQGEIVVIDPNDANDANDAEDFGHSR
jgi:hypothetical protein